MSRFRAHAPVLQTARRWQCLSILLLTLGMLFAACPANGSDYFVAPDGNDLNDGSIDHPFRTITKAVEMVLTGDNIFLRDGQHDYSQTIQISSSKSGEDGNLITLQAYQDEVPILDFNEQPYGSASRGINLGGDYWHLKGFVIQYAGDNGINVKGSNNIMEELVTRWNSDSGLQLHGSTSPAIPAANNAVINCDSYENYDAPNHGQNADGFAAKFKIGPGNEFWGCRAWNNSDDGWDFWDANNGVTVEDCWAFRNGDNIWDDPLFEGNANGFKLGHGAGAHVLIRCVAYDHRVHGIDLNGNTTGVTIYNCTCAESEGYNFYFDEHNDVHKMRNNLSHLGSVRIFDEIDDEYNSWNGFTVSDTDFASLDPNGLDGPREPDGGLPALSFLRLTWSSSLVDGGIDVNEPFEGDAPDLGAFERLYGDSEPDGDIDLADLECLVANWLTFDCGECNGADFDGNGDVDLYDFNKLAGNWLKY